MRAIKFNSGWTCKHLKSSGPGVPVTIPHDAMISEPSSGSINAGCGERYDCLCEKKFIPGPALMRKKVVLELDGVCPGAEFFLNSEQLAFQSYGGAGFYVDLTDKLRLGVKNTFKVIARNADRPDPHGYSSTEICFPATLWVAPKEHIQINGLKVRTVSMDPATVEITVLTEGTGAVTVQISDGEQVVVTGITRSDGKADFTIAIPDGKPRGTETPNLYTCKASFGEDSAETTFGICS